MMRIALQRNISFTSVGSACNPVSKSFKAGAQSMMHLEGERVEPTVGALLKPPQGKRCSSVPDCPPSLSLITYKHIDQMSISEKSTCCL